MSSSQCKNIYIRRHYDIGRILTTGDYTFISRIYLLFLESHWDTFD
jgi:hypothetical protein